MLRGLVCIKGLKAIALKKTFSEALEALGMKVSRYAPRLSAHLRIKKQSHFKKTFSEALEALGMKVPR